MDYSNKMKALTGLLAVTIMLEDAELSEYDKERGLARGADGKWTSNKSESATAALETPAKSLDALEVNKTAQKINGLPAESKQGFVDSCLKDNKMLAALSSTLSDAAKKGFDAGHRLLRKVVNIDVEKSLKQFGDGAKRLIGAIKEDPANFALGLAALGMATWGVMSVASGVAGAIALPGVVGEAMAIGSLKQVGMQLAEVADNLAWGVIKLGVILPHIGSLMIAKAFSSESKESPTPNPVPALNTKAALKKLDAEKVVSDDILKLYGLERNSIEDYKKVLEVKQTDGQDKEASAKATQKLLRLNIELKQLERYYNLYINSPSESHSASYKQLLDGEIADLQKEISEEKDTGS